MKEADARKVNSSEKFHHFIRQRNEEADRAMRPFVLGFFVFGILIAPFYSTWAFALGIGGICLAAYFVCSYWLPGTYISRVTISLIFSAFMLQFIGQMHGMYEMHFFFFINITILLIYQDWRVMAPYTIATIGHHLIFFYLQMQGYDVQDYFVSIDTVTYTIVGFHCGLAALMAVVCGWWSVILKNRSVEDFRNQSILEQQVSNMNYNIAFASEITQGNLGVEYELNEDDELGDSLYKMRNRLLESSKRDKQDKFTSTGLAEIGTILRDNASDLNELSQQVVSYIINYLKINQGGMFILQKDDGDPYLSLTACYAYGRKKYQERRIALGEGLVGQAALEQDTIYLTDVPADYVNITSGLGDAPPRSILIVPLQSNKEVIGVMEFAAFRSFEPYEIEFLEKLAESIAASVIAVQTNQRTQWLLEQAQESEENMRAQEEEMRQNMEELQATQEEIDRKAREYEELLQEKDEKIRQLSASVGH